MKELHVYQNISAVLCGKAVQADYIPCVAASESDYVHTVAARRYDIHSQHVVYNSQYDGNEDHPIQSGVADWPLALP